VFTGFWWRNLRERDLLENPVVDGRNNIKMDLQDVGCGSIQYTPSRWLRIGAGGGHLWLR
jgi:hypothetical protein